MFAGSSFRPDFGFGFNPKLNFGNSTTNSQKAGESKFSKFKSGYTKKKSSLGGLGAQQYGRSSIRRVTDPTLKALQGNMMNLAGELANLDPSSIDNDTLQNYSARVDEMKSILDNHGSSEEHALTRNTLEGISSQILGLQDGAGATDPLDNAGLTQLMADAQAGIDSVQDGLPTTDLSKTRLNEMKGSLEEMIANSSDAGLTTALQGVVDQIDTDLAAEDGHAAALTARIDDLEAIEASANQGGHFQESGGSLTIEAEDYTALQTGTGGAAGLDWETAEHEGNTVLTTSDTGIKEDGTQAGPRADYSINFETAGTYYVYVKVHEDSNYASNSVELGMDGQQTSATGGLGVTAQGQGEGYHYVSEANGQMTTIEVTEAGTHTLNMWMREDGVKIDQIHITTDPNFDPNNATLTGASAQSAVSMTAGELSTMDSVIESAAAPMPTASAEEQLENLQSGLSNVISGASAELASALQDISDGIAADLQSGEGLDAALSTRKSEIQAVLDDAGSRQYTGGNMFIEAEDYTSAHAGTGSYSGHEWSSSSAGEAGTDAVGEYMVTNNNGTNARSSVDGARLDYDVNFQQTGDVKVWVRMYQEAGSHSNNSVHLGMDGQIESDTLGLGVTTQNVAEEGAWTWVNMAVQGIGNNNLPITSDTTMNVDSVGNHTLNVVMREDGTKIDGIMISDDMNFDPNSVGENYTGAGLEPELTTGQRSDLENLLISSTVAGGTEYGERLTDMSQQLDTIKSTLGGGATQANLQEAYNRVNNLLNQIDETSASDVDHEAIQEMRSEVADLKADLEPHVDASLTTHQTKADGLKSLQRDLEQTAAMVHERASVMVNVGGASSKPRAVIDSGKPDVPKVSGKDAGKIFNVEQLRQAVLQFTAAPQNSGSLFGLGKSNPFTSVGAQKGKQNDKSIGI